MRRSGRFAVLCTDIQGNLNDPSFEIMLRQRLGGSFTVDAVVLDWDETRRRVLRATTEQGRDVGIRLGDAGLTRGLADGDVLGTVDDSFDGRPVVVAVRLRSAEVLQVEIPLDAPQALAQTAWEVGNMHAPLFHGDAVPDALQLLTPDSGPLRRVLSGIPGVRVQSVRRTLEPSARFSTRIVDVLVRRAPDMKIVRKPALATAHDANGDGKE